MKIFIHYILNGDSVNVGNARCLKVYRINCLSPILDIISYKFQHDYCCRFSHLTLRLFCTEYRGYYFCLTVVKIPSTLVSTITYPSYTLNNTERNTGYQTSILPQRFVFSLSLVVKTCHWTYNYNVIKGKKPTHVTT